MTEVGSYEAKTHLASLLDRVARGERITITKHGVPVAVLVPFDPQSKPDPAETIAQLRRFRRGRKLGRHSLKKMIEEGRA
jgi:prevent-host-death family protein